MIAFIIFCSDIDLEDVKKIVVDLPMTLFRGTLQPCHCFNCDDVMNRLTSKFSTLSTTRQVNKRNFQFVAAWYEKNKDGCSKADKDDLMQFIQLDEFLMSDLIKIVKPSGLFPDEEVDEMILAQAEKLDQILLDEEN